MLSLDCLDMSLTRAMLRFDFCLDVVTLLFSYEFGIDNNSF